MSDDRISIAGLAAAINRRPSTIRSWCRYDQLPENLRPHRADGDGWRFWTPEQCAGIQAWMEQKSMVPGGGLRNYTPTPEQTDGLLAKLRETRGSS